MSVNNTAPISRLRKFLAKEGWNADSRIEKTEGLTLYTHSSYPDRQLVLPLDTRFDDWEEACGRAIVKVADMTGRSVHDVRNLVEANRSSRPAAAARSFLYGAVVASAAVVLAHNAYGWLNATPPVSVSLAGCMDSGGWNAAALVSRDAGRIRLDDDPMKGFAKARLRALEAAANAEDMRRCYLEAQSNGRGFDPDGRIGEDMRVIEEAVKTVYADIGARIVSLEPESGNDREQTVGSASAALSAASRISSRLGSLVDRWYF